MRTVMGREPILEYPGVFAMSITVAEAGHRGGTATAKNRTPEERSEAARRAVNARWAKVRAQVAESRKAQGLPETVPAGPVLDQLAAEVLGGGGDG
jgi:hypothetical protein